MLRGNVLDSRFLLRQTPLLLTVLLFCLIMVKVRYRVESLNKQKEAMQKEVGYLREQRVQMQKQYQESIRISRIDRDLDTIGVGLVPGPPYELRR
ncbi:MAG: hypothetical protein IJR26_04290 [Bacteroidales bacterium]|nr:hypothetical protein [Bacteroidales bacterium]